MARFQRNRGIFDKPSGPAYKIFVFIMFIIHKKSALIVLLIGTIILLLPDSARPASGQDTDPFYRKTLESGEASYLAKSFEEAVRNLEIAVFGLAKEKTLQARGYVFLALSRAALQQKDLTAENLASAIALIGKDELRVMNLPEGAKAELEKLLTSSAGRGSGSLPVSPAPPPKKEIETLPTVRPQTESPAPAPQTAPVVSPVERLREAMKTNPRDPLSYYELASHYRENKDIANARKTLETLLARNPAEIRGYLEIGRLEYAARNLKAAEKILEKFLALTASVRMEDRLRDEGRALLLLSAWLRGDAKKTAKLFALSEDLFQAGRLDDLSLDPQDKERLRALRESRKK
jgi:tetratricopeptide (TPR) repeat protein